jgi:hypothetical protein
MASNDRQVEETRIRRALDVTSFDLYALEQWLVEQGHVPDSTDEEAARDAVFKLRKLFQRNTFHVASALNDIFAASDDVPSWNVTAVRESESVKYDAVRDFILMIAARKAQALATQEQRASDATVKEGRA